MNQALLIFIKNPELGKAKTRLAASVGDEKALEIYLQLLAHTRQVALDVKAERHLYYSSFVDNNDAWSNELFVKSVQQGDELGERMTLAFEQVFKSNDRVVIIGSDCKELSPELVNQAFAELERHEFVVGPALDGGYYLLGMRNYHPEVFEDVEWSTEKTLQQTLAKMISPSHSVLLLPALSDIDYIEDWQRVVE